MSIENKSIPGASQQWFGLLALLAQVAQALQEHYFMNICLTENNTSLGNSELSCQYSLYRLQDNQALIIHDYYSFLVVFNIHNPNFNNISNLIDHLHP